MATGRRTTKTAAMEPRFPIRSASLLSGVALETLRAWERRHGVVTPARDARGRLYSEADVRKLRLLKKLVDHGHAIGRLAKLDADELEALQSTSVEAPESPTDAARHLALDALESALERFDSVALDTELGRRAALLAPRDFIFDVALPLMQLVGERWQARRFGVAQEHLASAALRAAVSTLVRLHVPDAARTRLLFATPSGERHEFGLLAAAMLAAARGRGVIYLGADVPADEILLAARRTSPHAVVLAVTGAGETSAALAGVHALATKLPRGVELWAGGARTKRLGAQLREAGAVFLDDLAQYEARL